MERQPERSDAEQLEIDTRCERLKLYHFSTCPFCVRVRNVIKQLELKIEERNIHHSEAYALELAQGGGSSQVPCLRIEEEDGSVSWMYESNDIIHYLQEQFSP